MYIEKVRSKNTGLPPCTCVKLFVPERSCNHNYMSVSELLVAVGVLPYFLRSPTALDEFRVPQ